ncbi:hypothetical protein NIES25_34750 [Nostoc linckia NIES-25]|nr:hypothetical protein NIES25_34750 [Nostoc linckia NIES-25]
MKFSIQQITNRKGEIVEGILRSLPNWFGIESGIVEYCDRVNELSLFAAVAQTDAVVGFLSLKEHNELTGEIYRNIIVRALARLSLNPQLNTAETQG